MANDYRDVLGITSKDGISTRNKNVASKPLQLGTYHMVKNTDFEPQRTNNFEVQIVGLDTLLMPAEENTYVPSNISELITLSVASFQAPSLAINPIQIHYANNMVNFAGKPTFSGGDLVINDYIGIDIERLLMAWMNTVYNPETQEIGNAVDYKKTAYLIEYNPKGTLCRQWQINGCFPTNISLGSFDQSNANVRTISMTLTFDNAIPLSTSGTK